MASRPVRASRAPDDDGQGGFSIIEVIVGLGVFAVLAIGFAGTMATSLNAQLRSRQRATAMQLATEQVEQARSLAYDDVGTVGGNPVGTLSPSRPVPVGTATYRVQTDVELVPDQVQTAFTTYADYKRLVVTVTRAGSGTPLARLRTLIAPPTQPSLTKAIVQAEVVDSSSSANGVPGVTVQISGPQGTTRLGVTDARGYVIFPALPPTQGSETYALAATTVPAPWQLFAADQVSADVAGPALATQTKVLRLRLSRPVPVQLAIKDALGATYAVSTDVTVSSIRGTASYNTSTGSLGPIDLWSGLTYTIAASSRTQPTDTTARFSTPITLTTGTSGVTANGTLTLVSRSTVPFTVKVRKPDGTTGLASIAVRISGGPNNLLLTGTTGAGGDLVVPLPAGAGYTVAVDAQSGWAAKSAAATVAATGPTGATLVLAAGP